jgi:hypothetical protein
MAGRRHGARRPDASASLGLLCAAAAFPGRAMARQG